MGHRTITGRLAADPTIQQVGRISITKLTVIENTGDYRAGEWRPDETPTGHYIEAKFELGEDAAERLAKGQAVTVTGYERTNSWEHEGRTQYRRVIEASDIAASIRTKRPREGGTVEAPREQQPTAEQHETAADAGAFWEVAPVGQGSPAAERPDSFGESMSEHIAQLADEREQALEAGDTAAVRRLEREAAEAHRAIEHREGSASRPRDG